MRRGESAEAQLLPRSPGGPGSTEELGASEGPLWIGATGSQLAGLISSGSDQEPLAGVPGGAQAAPPHLERADPISITHQLRFAPLTARLRSPHLKFLSVYQGRLSPEPSGNSRERQPPAPFITSSQTAPVSRAFPTCWRSPQSHHPRGPPAGGSKILLL